MTDDTVTAAEAAELEAYVAEQGTQLVRQIMKPGHRPFPDHDNPMFHFLIKTALVVAADEGWREALLWVAATAWAEGELNRWES